MVIFESTSNIPINRKTYLLTIKAHDIFFHREEYSIKRLQFRLYKKKKQKKKKTLFRSKIKLYNYYLKRKKQNLLVGCLGFMAYQPLYVI